MKPSYEAAEQLPTDLNFRELDLDVLWTIVDDNPEAVIPSSQPENSLSLKKFAKHEGFLLAMKDYYDKVLDYLISQVTIDPSANFDYQFRDVFYGDNSFKNVLKTDWLTNDSKHQSAVLGFVPNGDVQFRGGLCIALQTQALREARRRAKEQSLVEQGLLNHPRIIQTPKDLDTSSLKNFVKSLERAGDQSFITEKGRPAQLRDVANNLRPFKQDNFRSGIFSSIFARKNPDQRVLREADVQKITGTSDSRLSADGFNRLSVNREFCLPFSEIPDFFPEPDSLRRIARSVVLQEMLNDASINFSIRIDEALTERRD